MIFNYILFRNFSDGKAISLISQICRVVQKGINSISSIVCTDPPHVGLDAFKPPKIRSGVVKFCMRLSSSKVEVA